MVIAVYTPDTIGPMWPHAVNLLSRSWVALVSGLGTTTLAVFVAFVGFVFVLFLNLVFKLRKDGWKWAVTVAHFGQNLKDSLLPTVIGTLFLWAMLFGYFVVRTVYSDHQELVSANNKLHETNTTYRQSIEKLESDNLKLVDPKTKSSEIAELKKQLRAYESSEIRIFPVAHSGQLGIPRMEYVMTTGKVRTPVNLTAQCSFPISEFDATFLTPSGGSIRTLTQQRISPVRYKVTIDSPVWSPSSPLWVTVTFGGSVDRMPLCSFSID